MYVLSKIFLIVPAEHFGLVAPVEGPLSLLIQAQFVLGKRLCSNKTLAALSAIANSPEL